MDLLSTVLLKQQGFFEKTKANNGIFNKSTIVLSDVKQEPISFLKLFANFFVHRLSLSDVKGLTEMCKSGAAESQ